jgi:hypothetical protein
MSCASPDDNDVKQKKSSEKSGLRIGHVPLHVVSRIKSARGTHNQIHIHPLRNAILRHTAFDSPKFVG